MIVDFQHKGLENFFHNGSKKGIQPKHAERIARILDRLDASEVITDMNLPGYNPHQLKGPLKNHWAVNVSGNWRITFKFENGDAYVVDYQDYH